MGMRIELVMYFRAQSLQCGLNFAPLPNAYLALLCGSPGLCLEIIAVLGTQLFCFKIMNIKLAFK